MSEPTAPVRSFWRGALLFFGGCLLIWLAVQLLASIWLWIVLFAAVSLIAWAAARWWRWRRRRW